MTKTKTPRYQLLSEDLLDKIEGLPRAGQEEYLFLSASDEFKGRWEVTSLWPSWFFDFQDIVGHYRSVSPSRLDGFLSFATDGGYKVIFSDPPESILDAYEHLQDPPPFSLQSTLDNTTNGMFPWQIECFNRLIKDESLSAGLVIHSTGAGKTAVIASAILWHEKYGHPYDLALVVVKRNNRTDMQRKLKALAGLDSFVVSGTPTQRDAVYAEVGAQLEEQGKVILITNYESFRNDDEMFKWLVEDRDVLCYWDEMPTRLSNRTTQLYEAVQKCLWKTFQPRKGLPTPRPKWLRQWMLTATPIENSPAGLFNCIAGDTKVNFMDGPGDLLSVYKIPYRGPLIKIVTANGSQVTIGPNHAMLTDKGWIAAKLLREGDYVCRRSIQGPLSSTKNLNHRPTQIENLFETLRSAGFRTRRKRCMAKDFHDDGAFSQGDIHVVDTNGLLRNYGKPFVFQKINQSHLVRAFANCTTQLLGQRNFFTRLTRSWFSKLGLCPRSAPGYNVIFPTRTPLDPRFLHTVVNQPFADAHLFSNGSSRELILGIHPCNGVDINIHSPCSGFSHNDMFVQPFTDGIMRHSDIASNFGDGLTTLVTLDEIVNVELIEDWVGHVYDCSTRSNVYYADGIVINNCVRLLDPLLLGTVGQFESDYVINRNPISHKPERWGRLDKLEGKIEFMTHRVSRKDPEVAKMFPKIMEDTLVIDWDPRDRAIYDMLATNAVKILEEESESEEFNVLALIQVMQMMCDAPSMIGQSAENHKEFKKVVEELGEDDTPNMVKGSEIAVRLVETLKRAPTDDRHTKFETL